MSHELAKFRIDEALLNPPEGTLDSQLPSWITLNDCPESVWRDCCRSHSIAAVCSSPMTEIARP
jgi:hypothetical protein